MIHNFHKGSLFYASYFKLPELSIWESFNTLLFIMLLLMFWEASLFLILSFSLSRYCFLSEYSSLSFSFSSKLIRINTLCLFSVVLYFGSDDFSPSFLLPLLISGNFQVINETLKSSIIDWNRLKITFADVSIVKPKLLFDVIFLQETLYIDLVGLVELIFFLFLYVLVDYIINFLVSHVILIDLVGYFIKHCLMSNGDSEQWLLEFLIRQTSEIISRHLFLLRQCPKDWEYLLGWYDHGRE